MRLETPENEEIKLNMTAMIDIVFQLLVFFIMTFKVVAQEGDFNVKMPLASTEASESMEDEPPELIRISLRAGENGGLNSILVDDSSDMQTIVADQTAEMYSQLTGYVANKLAGESNPEDGVKTEVEFNIDYSLQYKFTVDAIGAVSGKKLPDGSVQKLIEKIKFKDKRAPGA